MDRRPSNEEKPQSKTGTLKPSLNLISKIKKKLNNKKYLLKRTTSMRCMSNLPFESTCGHLFFRKPAPMAFEERRMHYPMFTPLGNWRPCNTNTAQEIPGKFIHHVPTLRPKLDSPIRLRKMGFCNSPLSQCTAHLHKETCIWPAFTVKKFQFFHNQF